MTFPDFVEAYQWNYRPQHTIRPDWFKEWPGGARMAVMLILLHEWESVPAPTRPMPRGAHHTFDYLALGAREYGARSASGACWTYWTGTMSRPRSSKRLWSLSYFRKACERSEREGKNSPPTGGTNRCTLRLQDQG
jgi:hypothetical protein